jgi:hypothetical protein
VSAYDSILALFLSRKRCLAALTASSFATPTAPIVVDEDDGDARANGPVDTETDEEEVIDTPSFLASLELEPLLPETRALPEEAEPSVAKTEEVDDAIAADTDEYEDNDEGGSEASGLADRFRFSSADSGEVFLSAPPLDPSVEPSSWA